MRKGSGLSVLIILASFSALGCLGSDSVSRPSAELMAAPIQIDVGEAVNLDARASSTPDPTILMEYRWEFGDGQRQTTVHGFVTHVYNVPGDHIVRVTVVNNEGGEDSATVQIIVNSPPLIGLQVPERVLIGDMIDLDASGSSDPEGGELEITWDLDLDLDSDLNGDSTDDVDASGPITSLQALHVGVVRGAVTVSDILDSKTRLEWNVSVESRQFKVRWIERTITIPTIDDYTEEGDIWTSNMTPGADGRIYSMNATLILDYDYLHQMPQDNFTLRFRVPLHALEQMEHTHQENLTKNATAQIDISNLNPYPASEEIYEAMSKESLVARLLGDPELSVGNGIWVWSVEADESDPDCEIPNSELGCPDTIPDPDDGNHWTLEIEYVILVPAITEITLY